MGHHVATCLSAPAATHTSQRPTDVAVRQDHRETRKRVAAQLDTLIAAGVRHAVRPLRRRCTAAAAACAAPHVYGLTRGGARRAVVLRTPNTVHSRSKCAAIGDGRTAVRAWCTLQWSGGTDRSTQRVLTGYSRGAQGVLRAQLGRTAACATAGAVGVWVRRIHVRRISQCFTLACGALPLQQ